MRVGVFGAGAVGSYIGGLLASQGVPTTLVARGDHASAMAAGGLHLDRPGTGTMDVTVTVTTDASALADVDLIIVTVKSPDTNAAAELLAPHVPGGTAVLSIQNGVGNWARIADRLPGAVTVLAGVALFGVEMLVPGRVRLALPGPLVLGDPNGRPADAVHRVSDILGMALDVSVVEDLPSAAWAKLVINADMAVLAICDAVYPDDLIDPDLQWLCLSTLEEAETVVRGAGLIESVTPVSAALERKLELLRTEPRKLADSLAGRRAGFRASTVQSILRGRAHETHYLNGEVVRVAASQHLNAPINDLLTREMEERTTTGPVAASVLRRKVEQAIGLAEGTRA
jgi:2-dehydropantoate 2-reductase